MLSLWKACFVLFNCVCKRKIYEYIISVCALQVAIFERFPSNLVQHSFLQFLRQVCWPKEFKNTYPRFGSSPHPPKLGFWSLKNSFQNSPLCQHYVNAILFTNVKSICDNLVLYILRKITLSAGNSMLPCRNFTFFALWPTLLIQICSNLVLKNVS